MGTEDALTSHFHRHTPKSIVGKKELRKTYSHDLCKWVRRLDNENEKHGQASSELERVSKPGRYGKIS